jgi:integrase
MASVTFKGAERNVTDLQPKDRDIAMVFQNYALYPHMSVADNMAFALRINTNDRSTPPARQAPAPEMQAWTAPEAAHFLAWADVDDRDLGMGWQLLVATGMRRGEALALRWRDVDLDLDLELERSRHCGLTAPLARQP